VTNVLIKIKTIKGFLFLLLFWLQGCEQAQSIKPTIISPTCLASQSHCKITSAHGDFSVLFNVEKVITENEFDIVLVSHEHKIKNVSAHIEGKNMFMGKIPLFFEDDDNSNHLTLTAKTMLGSCSEANMRWIIWFDVTMSSESNEQLQARFFVEFNSVRA